MGRGEIEGKLSRKCCCFYLVKCHDKKHLEKIADIIVRNIVISEAPTIQNDERQIWVSRELVHSTDTDLRES